MPWTNHVLLAAAFLMAPGTVTAPEVSPGAASSPSAATAAPSTPAQREADVAANAANAAAAANTPKGANTANAPNTPANTDEPEPDEDLRHVTLAIGLGFHNLVPLGIMLGFNFTPQWTLDVGLGYSFVRGMRIGARARYQFIRGPVTPFLGVGAFVNPSTREYRPFSLPAPGGGRPDVETYHAGWFIDPTIGVILHGPSGTFGLLGAGYAIRLSSSPQNDGKMVSLEAHGGFSF